MTTLSWMFTAFGLVILIFGIQSLLFVPLSLLYEVWKKRFLRKLEGSEDPVVTVIVPAYNEERTIARSLESILASDYPAFELLVVNDGSTDTTEKKVRPLLRDPRVRYLRKSNGGKASALNFGLAAAKGDIILYTDADSFFLPDTIRKMTRWFADPAIGAVSGNDAPMNPESSLQKLLTVTTHIGSGFVRRALSIMGTLVIISGNIGAVRKNLLRRVNGFTDIWGEDLDLTFKLHKIRSKIIFDPDAMVLCDVPRSFGMLWKQRVRWMRSFLKICAMHKTLFFNPKYAPFSLYLPINYFNIVFIPLLLVAALMLLPVLAFNGLFHFGNTLDVLAHFGYVIFFAISVYSIVLDRSLRDLRLLPIYGWLIVPVSYFYNGVVLYSIWKEAAGASEEWHKIERRQFDEKRPAANRWRTALVAATLLCVVAGGSAVLKSTIMAHPEETVIHVSPMDISSLTLATHFDAWTRPSDAITSVLESKTAGHVTQVAVGAGRYEWNFFRWKGHRDTWSNDQKVARGDLMTKAVQRIHAAGKRAVVIVDMFAPNYLKQHPEYAALDVDGVPSREQVCFTELVAGEYGKKITAMVSYLAENYDIDAISITELEYHRYCYDDRCLRSFQRLTERTGWPRKLFRNAIDREARLVEEWRSRLLATWLKQLTNSAHAYGKKLYVDVPVHFDRIENQAMESGLYYPYVLKVTDGIVAWDYFYLDGRSPKTCREVARFFTTRFDPNKVIISQGLWGTKKPVSPEELAQAVAYSISGGAMNLWITPNHLLTNAHTDALMKSLAPRVAQKMEAPRPSP